MVRVQLPEPVYEEITISPSTSQIIRTPSSGKNGISKVTVEAVTSAIDSNIKPENIVKNVTILGVTGNVEFITDTLEVNPTTANQVFNPTHDGFSTVRVNAVTSSIDTNIKAKNIRNGVNILGVVGNLIESNETTRDITVNGTFTPPSPYTGFSQVVVDVHVEQEELTINPSTTVQVITTPDRFHGYSPITVNPVTSAIDGSIQPENIKQGVTILGVTGSCVEVNNTTKHITSNGTHTPSGNYTGFSSVTVDVDTVNNTDITITANGIYNAPSPYTGYGRVEVDINTVNNTSLTVTPTTSQQVFNPPSPYTGYTPVTINAVTSAIDSNIKASNIKSGVTILGVSGSVTELKGETRNVSITSTSGNTFTPSSGKNGITSITVTPTNQAKTLTVNASTSTTTTIYPDSNYSGLSSVTVDMSWVEQQLQALNAGDTTETYNLQNKTLTQAGTYTADAGYDGFGTVTIDLSWVDTAIEQASQGACDGTADQMIAGTAVSLASDADNVRSYAFFHEGNLQKVVLNNATSIGEYAFAYSSISTLVINTSTLCSLASTNAFTGTLIESIKVPSSLVNSYKTAANWSSYATRISAI